jgi:excisionase family DNA binding protein
MQWIIGVCQGYCGPIPVCGIIREKIGVEPVDKPYLTVDQVAEILAVTPETVRSYIAAKKNPLPAYKLGREYRIDRKDFAEWMQGRKNVHDDDEP